MSYTNFTTKNADYRLILSCHTKKNTEPVHDLDAIVLEIGDPNNSLEGEIGYMPYDPQYKNIIKAAEQNNILLYSTDVKTKSILEVAELIAFFGLYPPSIFYFASTVVVPGFITSLYQKKIPWGLENYLGMIGWIFQEGVGALRSAICAKKTEEFIAPQLQEKLGRKPKIGIVYGSLHADIKLQLQYQKLRDFTLWNHRTLNFKKFWGLKKAGIKDLNKVQEAQYDGEQWHCKEHHLEGMI